MPDDTVTLVLDGEVHLDDFAKAIQSFSDLLTALSREITGESNIEWIIEELSAGSATATARGYSEDALLAESVVLGFHHVGAAMERGAPIPYSARVGQPARNLAKVINGGITSMRFETSHGEATLASPSLEGDKPKIQYNIGQIAGVVETLTRRRGLKFTLYDLIFDRAVACYLKKGQEDEIRDAWGRYVMVSGSIGRSTEDGKPALVRDILRVEVLKPVPPGHYKRARGAIHYSEDMPSPEELIRRMRDA